MAGPHEQHRALQKPAMDFKSLFEGHPHFADVGFASSYLSVIVLCPAMLLTVLILTCSSLKVPLLVKLFLNVVACMATPAYLKLSSAILQYLWECLAWTALALAATLPLFAALSWAIVLTSLAGDYYEGSRNQHVHLARGSHLGWMGFGVVLGTFSFCASGVAAALLILCRSPFILVAVAAAGAERAASRLNARTFVPWCAALLVGVCSGAALIGVAALACPVVAAVWTCYVVSLWPLYSQHEGSCFSNLRATLLQGLRASYHVVWVADAISGATVVLRWSSLRQILQELLEVGRCERERMSDECAQMGCFPPVVVGAFLSWAMVERAAAVQLELSVKSVRASWSAFRQELLRCALDSIATGLLDRTTLKNRNSAVVVGLSAIALFRVLRSPEDSPVAFSDVGQRVLGIRRPQHGPAQRLWENVHRSKSAVSRQEFPADNEDLFPAFLLAVSDTDAALPLEMGELFRRRSDLSGDQWLACRHARDVLLAVAKDCASQIAFREQVWEILRGL